ncbi:hypothetical protein [Komagataeibacter swingsii]|uniref:Uncharacterized protein n=1 Tax=Komagataeibacter swingsii TaxID=215220 RepID=A0A850NSY4_9PROT|nr:hypothetical protein [Komagataeibacter swingsii]NVN35535.1 hypothetical protein [Komagataeibacter swingsii]
MTRRPCHAILKQFVYQQPTRRMVLRPNNANGVNFTLTFCQAKNWRLKDSFSPAPSTGRAWIIVRDRGRCRDIFVLQTIVVDIFVSLSAL